MWMDKMIRGAGIGRREIVDEEPFAELDLFFRRPPISRTKCPDVISYWGVS